MTKPGDEKTKKTKKTLEGVKVKAETTTPASEDLAKKPDDELQGLSSELGVDLLKEKDIDKILKLFQSGELKMDTLLKDSFKYIKKIDFKSLNINSEANNFNDAFNYFFEKFTGKNVLEKMAFLYATQYLMKEMKDFPGDKSNIHSYEFKLKGGKFEIIANKKVKNTDNLEILKLIPTKLLDQEFNKETLGKIDNDVTFLKANGSKLPIADVLKPYFKDNKTKKSTGADKTEKPKETDKAEKDEKIPDNKHGQMYLSLKKQMEENPQLKRNAFAKLALTLFKLLSHVTSWKNGMKPGIFKTKLKEEYANKNDTEKLKNFLSSENINPGPLEDLKKLSQERASTKYVASKIMKLGEIRDPVVLASKLFHSSYEVKGEKDSCYTQTDLDSLGEDGLKFGTVLILAPIIPSFYKKTAHTVAYVAKDKSIRYYSVKDNKEVTITGGLKEMATKFRIADAYVPNPNFLNNLGQVQATVSAPTNQKPSSKTSNIQATIDSLNKKNNAPEGMNIHEAVAYIENNRDRLGYLLGDDQQHRNLLTLYNRAEQLRKNSDYISKIGPYRFNALKECLDYPRKEGKLACAFTVSTFLGLGKNSGNTENKIGSVSKLASKLMAGNLKRTSGKSAGIVFGYKNYRRGDVLIHKGSHRYAPGSFGHTSIVTFNREIEVYDLNGKYVGTERYIGIQDDGSHLQGSIIPVNSNSRTWKTLSKTLKNPKAIKEYARKYPEIAEMWEFRKSNPSTFKVRANSGRWGDADQIKTGRIAFAVRTQGLLNA